MSLVTGTKHPGDQHTKLITVEEIHPKRAKEQKLMGTVKPQDHP